MSQKNQADIYLDDGELCRTTIYSKVSGDDTLIHWPRTPGHYLVMVVAAQAKIAVASGTETESPKHNDAGYLSIADLQHPWTVKAAGPQGRMLTMEFSRRAYANVCAPGCSVARLNPTVDVTSPSDPIMLQLALGLLGMWPWPTSQDGNGSASRVVRAMLLHLAEKYGYSENTRQAGRDGLSQWQLRRASAYVESHLDAKINVPDVAETCALSPNYFNRLFKRTTGLTLHQWVLEQRVAKARQLLAETSMPLSEVAMVTGFADQTHFTRVFSNRNRMSPMAWRRFALCNMGTEKPK